MLQIPPIPPLCPAPRLLRRLASIISKTFKHTTRRCSLSELVLNISIIDAVVEVVAGAVVEAEAVIITIPLDRNSVTFTKETYILTLNVTNSRIELKGVLKV